MTAIIGLQYLDGIILMADTEESLGPDAKSECEKLYRFPFPVGDPATAVGTALTGGAGDSHMIDCANVELQRLLKRGELGPKTDVLDFLNSFAKRFITETMKPYRGLAYETVVPQSFELLIAVVIPPSSRWLFCWKGSSVLPLPQFTHTSIGCGVVQIHPMLRDLQFSASKECMLFHGMRMMFAAKRSVTGVGGRTEAIALQDDGRTHYFGIDILKKIEDLMVNYEQFKTKILDETVLTIACEDPKIEPELERNVEATLSGISSILKMYRQTYKNIFRQSGDQTSTDQQ